MAEAVIELEEKAMQMLERFQHPSPSDLIAQASAFHHLTQQGIEALAANAKRPKGPKRQELMGIARDKNCTCHTCEKDFHYLGIARHRSE